MSSISVNITNKRALADELRREFRNSEQELASRKPGTLEHKAVVKWRHELRNDIKRVDRELKELEQDADASILESQGTLSG
jgi:flagellar hook-associated protein FlgK